MWYTRPYPQKSMSLYDYFEPAPPIQCPICGNPMRGWQGEHLGFCCFFVWREGLEFPREHRVSEDCRVNDEQLKGVRLERGLIPISGAECSACGHKWQYWRFQVIADARSGTWVR